MDKVNGTIEITNVLKDTLNRSSEEKWYLIYVNGLEISGEKEKIKIVFANLMISTDKFEDPYLRFGIDKSKIDRMKSHQLYKDIMTHEEKEKIKAEVIKMYNGGNYYVAF